MQPAEKRKNLRRAITYPAFIDLGDASPARECVLRDASQDGAQLTVSEPKSVPDQFILALSADGAARRRCRVMWRTEAEIGVEFIKDVRKAPRPSRVRAMAAGAESADAPKEAAAPSDAVPGQVDIDTLSPRG